jgi:peptidoglycan/LPS O-acetylase OafA/YrhL
MANAGRLAFANQLRGLAAILVACSHLIGVYWTIPVFVAAATFSPVQHGTAPLLLHFVANRWFRFGPFGVGLFFLISGLVIPYSLAKHSRRSFLLARLLRIYPPFILALLIELAVLYASSRYWHRPFGYGLGSIVENLSLVNNLIGAPVIDFVNWTLTIELLFYGLVVVLAGAIRRGNIAMLFGVAVAIVLMNVMIGPHGVGAGVGVTLPMRVIAALSFESQYLVFMLIGVLFNFHNSGRIGTRNLLLAIAGMVVLFGAAASLGVGQPEYRVVTGNYLAALVVFGSLYAARYRIKNNRFLDFIASISFPFYLIHAVIGFTVIKILMLSFHFSYDMALVFAVTLIVTIALILHRTIELRTIALGHQFGSHYIAKRR